MAATVESVFRILDRASPTLDKIDAKATRLDEKLNTVGRTMDKMSGKTDADLKTMDSGFRNMSDSAGKSSSKVSASMGAMERAVARSTSSAQRDINQLQANLALLDAQNASPNVGLDGFAETLAQIKILQTEMRKLKEEGAGIRVGATVSEMATEAPGRRGLFGRRKAPKRTIRSRVFGAIADEAQSRLTASIATKRRAAGDKIVNKLPGPLRWALGGTKEEVKGADEATKATKRSAAAMSVWSRVAKTMAARAATVTAVVAAFGPVIESLAGGLGSLVGPTGAGIGAIGAGGTGLLGAAVVGFGGMYAASKPLFTQLGALNKTFQGYNMAVRQFGVNSQEARDAQQKLNATMRQNDRMGGASPEKQLQLLKARERLSQRWRKLTAPGQEATLGAMNDVLGHANNQAPFLAGIANQGARGVAGAEHSFMNTLDSPMERSSLQVIADMFEHQSPAVGRTMGNAARLFTNIAAASKPLVVDFIKWLDKWMSGAARDTGNLDKWSKRFKDWEKDLRAISHLFKQIGLWVGTFFGQGREPGRGLIKDFTVSVRDSRKEMQADPSKVQGWFQRMVNNTEDIVGQLGDMTASIGKLVDMLSRLIGPYSDVSGKASKLVGGIPGAGPLLAPFAGPAVAAGAFFGGRGLIKRGARRMGWKIGGGAAEEAAASTGMGVEGATAAEGAGAGAAASRFGALKAGGIFLGANAALAAATANDDYVNGGIGNINARAQNALSAASFGLFKGPKTRDQARAEATGDLKGQLGAHPTLKRINKLRRESQGVLNKGGNFADTISGEGSLLSMAFGSAPSDEDRTKAEEKIKLLNKIGDQVRKTQQITRGNTISKDIERAFDIRLHGKNSVLEAIPNLQKDMHGSFKGLGDDGKKQLAQNSLDWARAAAKGNPKMKAQVDNLADWIEKRFRRQGDHISVINGQIYDGTQTTWDKIEKAMASKAEKALEETTTSFTKLQQTALGQLQSMGYSHSEAANMMKIQEHGAGYAKSHGLTGAGQSQATSDANRAAGTHARGGIIPGRDLRDTYPIAPGQLAAGGERVTNQHTMGRIDRMLRPYGTSLDHEIATEGRPHNIPAPSRHARGGKLKNRGGGNAGLVPGHPELHTGISQAAEEVLSHFPGLSISSTTGGGHVSGSYHYLGEAVDIAGDSGTMLQASNWIKQHMLSSLTEGIHNPNLSVSDGKLVDPSFYSAVWAEHLNHIHLAVADAFQGLTGGGGGVQGGLGAAQSINLKGQKTKLKGIPGAMAQRAMDIQKAGLQKKINKKLGAMGGGAAGYTAGGGGPVAAQIMRVLMANGLTRVGAAGIAGNALQESGWNPASVGSGGGGLWGFTAGDISLASLQSFARSQKKPWTDVGLQTQFLLNHLGGVRGALNSAGSPAEAASVFMSQWERPLAATANLARRQQGAQQAFAMVGGGRGNAYGGKLGFAGWNARGGNFDVHGPTLFGAGEKGDEQVTISPKGKQHHGGNGPVTLHIGKIEVHRKGDVKKIIDEEFEKLGVDVSILSSDQTDDALA